MLKTMLERLPLFFYSLAALSSDSSKIDVLSNRINRKTGVPYEMIKIIYKY